MRAMLTMPINSAASCHAGNACSVDTAGCRRAGTLAKMLSSVARALITTTSAFDVGCAGRSSRSRTTPISRRFHCLLIGPLKTVHRALLPNNTVAARLSKKRFASTSHKFDCHCRRENHIDAALQSVRGDIAIRRRYRKPALSP